MIKRLKSWLLRPRSGHSRNRENVAGFTSFAEQEQAPYLQYDAGRRLALLVQQPRVVNPVPDTTE
jgi:hypothetical protein